MAYNYNNPYVRHENYGDLDGPSPVDFPFPQQAPPSHHPLWRAPSFRGMPEYHTSPPRAENRGRYSAEDFIPPVFPRTQGPPAGYPADYGVGHSFGSDYGRGPSRGGPDYDQRRPLQDFPHADFERRPPYEHEFQIRPEAGNGQRPHEFEQRPHPGYERRPDPEFNRRPQHEFEHRPQPGFQRRPESEFERRPDFGFERRPEPEFERRPEPQFERRPEPEFERRPEPEFERRPEPEFERRPEPEFERRPDFGFERRPEPEFHRRPEPAFNMIPEPDFERRPEPVFERRPEPVFERRPEPVFEPTHPPQEYDASAGRPPMPYEPDQHMHQLPESPRKQEPLMVPPEGYPKDIRPDSPPHHAVDVGAGAAHFPPMPYEPAASSPPPHQAAHDHVPVMESRDTPMMESRAPDGEAAFPPMPYEPEGRSPERAPHHHHGEGFMDGRGNEPGVPYTVHMGEMGGPLPFVDAHYGEATEHGHVKRKHFQGCKDYWAGFLFLLHFWVVVGICIYLGVKGVIKTSQNEDLTRAYELAPSPAPPVPERLYSMKNWAPQLAAATGSGWLFAFIWQWLIRLYPEPMIKICLCLGAVSTGLLGIILVSTGTAKGLVGLIFLALALFQGLYVHLVRHRIPFAAIMLRKALLVVHDFKGLYLISMWTVFLAMFWLAVWIFGVSGALSFKYGGYYVALLVLSLAWSMEVLRNTVNVTVAGVVGAYYYEGENMPHLPVLRAYQRAWTISFGSVCLGSMFVTPVTTLHAIAKRMANEQGANEFLFSCVNCLLGVLEFFIKHFNKWAFVEVGLHGKSFIRSAKETWIMFKQQGAMLLINDDLTGAVLLTGCIIGGVLTALVGGCWTFATHRYLTVGVSIISFFIGFFVTYLTMVVSESAVATYFVCFAEDPATLLKHHQPTFQYMNERKKALDQAIE